mmetsp:Transcript_156333/g.299776  ORF Transcript_156333/g.299776 Transcript_156333/m.299776 type:complete len:82 (-) Transcript_156333:703-948(-)
MPYYSMKRTTLPILGRTNFKSVLCRSMKCTALQVTVPLPVCKASLECPQIVHVNAWSVTVCAFPPERLHFDTLRTSPISTS